MSLKYNLPGGVPLGIFGGGVPARFSKSRPDFRPKNVIFHTRFQTRPLKSIPVFRPGLQVEIMLSLLRLEREQNNSSNSFLIRIFFFLSFLLIWNSNDKDVCTLPQFPQKPYPIPVQNGQRLYPFSDQNGTKTLPDGAAHTYIAYIRVYPPGYNPLRGTERSSLLHTKRSGNLTWQTLKTF